MKCRIDVKGRKLWIDASNAFDTRPDTTEIALYRDGEELKRITLDANGDGKFSFPCQLVWKNREEKYIYTVDEPVVPDGYTKRIENHNILNILDNIEINGRKIWDDRTFEASRPATITVRLLQNGAEVASVEVPDPGATEYTSSFTFGERPFADSEGKPFDYSIIEDAVANYTTTISGFEITNKYSSIGP